MGRARRATLSFDCRCDRRKGEGRGGPAPSASPLTPARVGSYSRTRLPRIGHSASTRKCCRYCYLGGGGLCCGYVLCGCRSARSLPTRSLARQGEFPRRVGLRIRPGLLVLSVRGLWCDSIVECARDVGSVGSVTVQSVDCALRGLRVGAVLWVGVCSVPGQWCAISLTCLCVLC